MGRPPGAKTRQGTIDTEGWGKVTMKIAPEVAKALKLVEALSGDSMGIIATRILREGLGGVIESMPLFEERSQCRPVGPYAYAALSEARDTPGESGAALIVTEPEMPQSPAERAASSGVEHGEPRAETAPIQPQEAEESIEPDGDADPLKKLEEVLGVHTVESVASLLATVRHSPALSRSPTKTQKNSALRDLRSWIDGKSVPGSDRDALKKAIFWVTALDDFDPFDCVMDK